jgi:mannose-1-phosphate guanylyltransferase
MAIVKSLLLSAGLGTRLRPYTNVLPKPCIPFWGLPMMYYSLYLLKKANCLDVTINLHHLPEKIKAMTTAKELADFRFHFSLEEERPLGSGGALYHAQNYLQDCDHFFAINGDEVMIPSTPEILNHLQEHHERQHALATLLVTDHPDLLKTLKPVWINREGLVRGFGLKPTTTEELRPVHYTGYKIFQQRILKQLPEGESNIFYDILVAAMKNGEKVSVLFDRTAWWETGNFDSLVSAIGQIIDSSDHQKYIQDIFKEFHLPYDYEVSVRGDYKLAKDKNLATSTLTFKDVVFLDSQCSIEAGSLLQNAIVGRQASAASLSGQMILPGEMG